MVMEAEGGRGKAELDLAPWLPAQGANVAPESTMGWKTVTKP